jgi:hypothetical protein
MRIARFILLAAVGLAGSFAVPAQTLITNTPPFVGIVTPTNNAGFEAPADIFIMANAIDRDGQVVEVSFFANQRYIGGVTNPPPDLSPLPPWRITWQGVPAGLYALQARATDNGGARSWSALVWIEVRGTNQPPPLPVVSVIADDPDAAEGGTTSWPNGGSFLFSRTGNTIDPLTIYFAISGTAENGADYQRIGESVTFPPGAALTHVYVRPLDDTLVEPTETVTVRIDVPICATVVPPPPGCYAGDPNNITATVYIRDAEIGSNSPPVVRIFYPTNEATFPEGADLRVCADAFDNTRYLDTVEFFANDKSLGIRTNNPFSLAPYAGFCVAWSNAPAGNYILTAKATDNFGLSATSPPVRITVGGPPPPTNQIVVTIEAVDSIATEQDPRLDIPTDPALLLVRRHGPTNVALLVQYRVGGSASNGVDYEKLSGEVAIPAGATTGEIFISAIDDALVEGTESVIVTVVPPICPAIYPPPPECYTVGRADTAIAYIRDNDFMPSNLPPAVRITAPANGALFREGSDVQIEAVTVDRDGYAPMVEFFANGRKIGEEVINFIQAPPDGAPIQFSFTWSNVVAGFYTLTARATDDEGATALSAPVGIRVGTNQPPPPPTNVVVSIVALDSFASEGPWTNSYTYPTITRGTNTAEFAVRRAGPTNDPVTVRYHIGGTASNGVDYAALSGEVVIPAGSRIARILVVPIEDTLVEGIETIVLELMRSASDAYVVGWPNRAAAIITDNDSPRPPCLRLPGGLFHLCLPGTNGTSYRLEGSSDLINWVELCTSTVTDGAIHFVDPDTAALPCRFYRAAESSTYGY